MLYCKTFGVDKIWYKTTLWSNIWNTKNIQRNGKDDAKILLSPHFTIFVLLDLRTLFPLTAFKNAPNPKFVKNLSRRLFFGVPIRKTQICQKFVETLKICPEIIVFQIFDKFLTNWVPLMGTPKKQSSGQIFYKFGVWDVFECCKGKKGSQILIVRHLLVSAEIQVLCSLRVFRAWRMQNWSPPSPGSEKSNFQFCELLGFSSERKRHIPLHTERLPN